MKKFFAPIILVFSADITAALAGIQNEPLVYWSYLKTTLGYIASALTALGDTTNAGIVTAAINGVGNEQIINWSQIKPVLVAVNAGLIALGETVLGATIDAQLQQIPNDNDQVYADQIKPILANISEALANLGQ